MSNCLQVLLCPVGGALATVRPVRSRSSAAPAASRDPASRKSSDGARRHPSSSSSSSPAHPSPSAYQAALDFSLLRFLTPSLWPSLLAGVISCSASRRSYSERSCCSKLPFRPFVTKTSLGVGGGASHLDAVFRALFQSLPERRRSHMSNCWEKGRWRQSLEIAQLQLGHFSDREGPWREILQSDP